MRNRCIALVAFLAWASWAAAQDSKPRLAIKTLDDPASAPKSGVGSALTEILTTELGKTGKYTIVERDAVQSILSELDLGASGRVNGQTAAAKGKLKGAEYALLGKVTSFGYRENRMQDQAVVGGVLTTRTVYQQQADVRVDFRIVSVESGEVVLTEFGQARQANVSEVSWMATWDRLMASSFSVSEMADSLLARTTLVAIRDVTRKLTDLSSELGSHSSASSVVTILDQLGRAEGKVMAVLPSNEFVVGIGIAHGAVKGDRLKVYSEVVTKDGKGQVVYRELKDSGTLLEIVDASTNMPDRSKARLLQTSAPATGPSAGIKDGDTVRIDVEHARTLRAPSVASTGRTPSVARATDNRGEEFESLVRRGDRYYDDRYYAQAVDYYLKATAINRDVTVVNKIADTHVRLGDIYEAETVYGDLIEGGLFASVHVVHAHAFGYCEGELRFERSRVSYVPLRGDDAFEITPPTLVAIEPGSANAAGYTLTGKAVAYVIQDSAGKRKKYTVFSNAFAEGDSSSKKERLDNTVKMSKLIERLTNKALK